MQIGDTIRARFMTLPNLFPGKAIKGGDFPIRTGTIVWGHPQGRFVVAECMGVKEAFRPEDIEK